MTTAKAIREARRWATYTARLVEDAGYPDTAADFRTLGARLDAIANELDAYQPAPARHEQPPS